MKKRDFQFLTGKVIIYSNGALFLSVIILFLLDGFLPDELTEIMKFLVPVQSVYMTAIVKFMIENKYVKKEEEEEEDGQKILNPFYVKITRLIVLVHILVILSGIILKGLGIIELTMLTSLVAVVETFFGVYIGGILLDLYKPAEPKK